MTLNNVSHVCFTSQEDIPAIRLMMADELHNQRVLPVVCGKDIHTNNENILPLHKKMDVSHVDNDSLQIPTCINDGFPQSPIKSGSCEPPVDDNSLQTAFSDSFPQVLVDDVFLRTPMEDSSVHILPHTPVDESPGDNSFSFLKKDNKINVNSWEELPEELQAVLPSQSQYTYVIDNFQTLPCEDFSGAPKFSFEFQARINISSGDQASQWLSDMFLHSKCTYRHAGGRQSKGQKVLYKAHMHCQHKKKPLTPKQMEKPKKSKEKRPFLESVRNKKTDCPSSLILTVTVPSNKMKRKSQLNCVKISHPTIIKMCFNHDHPVDSAHALSFRPIASQTKESYYRLFSSGHSVATARHTYETRMMLEADEEEEMVKLGDRAFNPNPQDVSRLYDEWRTKELGPKNGCEMFKKLDEMIENYNKSSGGKIVMQKYATEMYDEKAEVSESDVNDENEPPRKKRKSVPSPLNVAICTPLMARVHENIPQAGEIAFIDSTSSLDRYNLSMFVISTSHSGGGLPLGVLITSDEKAPTLEASLASFCGILPDKAFFGQGPSTGPQIIMSDDSSSQSLAVTATWPKARQLLCVFHVLQSFWTWLHDGKHHIPANHRQPLMLKVKDLVYAKTEQQLCSKYTELLIDKTVKLYPQFIEHVNTHWSRKEKWSICYREHLLVRGNHTNNYAESGIKIMKELVFSRIKAYNLIEMISFVVDTMDLYYKHKLLHLANNRIERCISLRFCGMKSSTIAKENIAPTEDPNVFMVDSQTSRGVVYTVDMQLSVCTCPLGSDGSPCSHQAAITKHFHYTSCNSIPSMFPEKRRELAMIALGDKAVQDLSYYSSLHQKADESFKCQSTVDCVEETAFDFSSNSWKIIKEGALDDTLDDSQHLVMPSNIDSRSTVSILDTQQCGSTSLLQDIEFVFNDLKERVKSDSDNHLSTGVKKFCERYKKMLQQSPNYNTLTSAFHKFGWVFGGTITRQVGTLRHGRRISVQAIAAGRRRKTLSRGKQRTQLGRPVKLESSTQRTKGGAVSRYNIPARNSKPPKRLHSFSTNVQLGQQNAGKW